MAKNVYDRMTNEGQKAYSAFLIYREMGEHRSIQKAWKQYSHSDKGASGYFMQWASDYNWVERAAAWDDHIEAQARKKLERDAIKRKAEMLQRHAMTGKVLQQKGLQYLNEANSIDKAADAINAITKGVDMERKSEGLPEWIFEVVNADDNELAREYSRILEEISGAESGDETAGDGHTRTAESSTAPDSGSEPSTDTPSG